MATVKNVTSIVELGLTLATSLQIASTAARRYEAWLLQLGKEVGFTSGILRELNNILLEDLGFRKSSNEALGALKPEGENALREVAAHCETIYRTVIANITKSAHGERRVKLTAAEIDTSKLKVEAMTQPSLSSWLRQRMALCLGQLKTVKLRMLVMLQMMLLARLQLYPSQKLEGKFGEEFSLRTLIGKVKSERRVHVACLLGRHRRIARRLQDSSRARKDEVAVVKPEEAPVEVGKTVVTPCLEAKDTTASSAVVVERCAQDSCSASPPPYLSEGGSNAEIRLEKVLSMSGEPSTNPKDGEILADTEASKDDMLTSIIKIQSKEADTLTMSAFQKRCKRVNSWIKTLFGPSSLFFDDAPSTDFEAYLVLGDGKRLVVPFGARRLKFGMKRLMKAKKESTMDDFSSLPKPLHTAISNSIQYAKVQDSRDKVLICFDILHLGDSPEDKHVLMFLHSTTPPVEPVHFKCAVGRKFELPYFMITKWLDMKDVVNQMYLRVDVLGPHVINGHYDLLESDGNIILPSCWEALIKPGMTISMFMWPMTTGPGPGPGPLAPRAVPPPCPATSIALSPHPGPSVPRRYPRGPPGLPGSRGPPPFPVPPPPPEFRANARGPLRPRPFPIRRRVLARDREPNRRDYDNSSDSHSLSSDSNVEAEECDLGTKIDYGKERDEVRMTTKQLLMKWTNAVDASGALSTSTCYTSDSDSTSSLASD